MNQDKEQEKQQASKSEMQKLEEFAKATFEKSRTAVAEAVTAVEDFTCKQAKKVTGKFSGGQEEEDASKSEMKKAEELAKSKFDESSTDVSGAVTAVEDFSSKQMDKMKGGA